MTEKNYSNVECYDAWYNSARGAWIGDTEFRLITRLMRPVTGQNVLDVGCGTGYFTRRFAALGLEVIGIDPDREALKFAAANSRNVHYVQSTAVKLPFKSEAFDHVSATTSLCFIAQPVQAVKEMWRVCRGSMHLGLLNRRSLLYRKKFEQGAYRGARWDRHQDVEQWLTELSPAPKNVMIRTAILTTGYSRLGRCCERRCLQRLPFGAFLSANMIK